MAGNYIICTTPRSGSTLLCTLLTATGRAGAPDSFYHAPHFEQEWADAWGLPPAGELSPFAYDAAYLEAVKRAGRGDSGVFGMRLQQEYLAPLAATLGRLFPDATHDAERFACALGPLRYLHLTRGDKVAQAVSLVTAQQSGLWHRNADGSERERTAPAILLTYDRDAIAAAVAALTHADAAWDAWFAREMIAPVRITYEALARDPAATVRAICGVLGIVPPAAAAIVPEVARLADEVSREWVARYRADEGLAPA